MNNRFLKLDVQSILLLICTIISGAGLARYIEYKEISMLLTFIGSGLTSLALTADIYRKRKTQK